MLPRHLSNENIGGNALPGHLSDENMVGNVLPRHLSDENMVGNALPCHLSDENIDGNTLPSHLLIENIGGNGLPMHLSTFGVIYQFIDPIIVCQIIFEQIKPPFMGNKKLQVFVSFTFEDLIHRFKRIHFFLCLLTILFFNKGFAQTKNFSLEEAKLAKMYSVLSTSADTDGDSTALYAEQFNKEFTAFIKANPASLAYPFTRLTDSNYCFIRTSADGNVRVYSWDTWTGGTMHEFNQIYQWKANGKVYTDVPRKNKDDRGSFCSKIYMVNVKNQVFYIAISNRIFSTKDASQSLSVFNIVDNKLIDTVHLFKTKTKQFNTIKVDFDFFSVVDRPERPLELIVYDEKEKMISIPVVNKQQQVTNSNILYQLTDNGFEFIGIRPGGNK